MKAILLISLFIVLLPGCKKASEPNQSDIQTLIGEWQWFKATGGMMGVYLTPQNSPFSWTLMLNTNNTYSESGNLWSASGNGSFALIIDPNPNWPRKFLELYSSGNVRRFDYSFITNDTLRLDNGVEVDGLSYFLVRK